MMLQQLRHEMEVVYVPTHAKGNIDHRDAERGLVTNWHEAPDGSVTVFVRYLGQLSGKATRIEDLVDPKAGGSRGSGSSIVGVEPGESL